MKAQKRDRLAVPSTLLIFTFSVITMGLLSRCAQLRSEFGDQKGVQLITDPDIDPNYSENQHRFMTQYEPADAADRDSP